MPDISMCRNESCPLKEGCYRYTATPSFWQSYSSFQYKIKENEEDTEIIVECKGFWDNKEYKNEDRN